MSRLPAHLALNRRKLLDIVGRLNGGRVGDAIEALSPESVPSSSSAGMTCCKSLRLPPLESQKIKELGLDEWI